MTIHFGINSLCALIAFGLIVTLAIVGSKYANGATKRAVMVKWAVLTAMVVLMFIGAYEIAKGIAEKL